MSRPKGILTFLQKNPPTLNTATLELEYKIPANQLLEILAPNMKEKNRPVNNKKSKEHKAA